MTLVFLIGYAQDTVDFSDPALPPGRDAEKIAAGIEAGLQQMRERGWEAGFCAIQPDDAAARMVSQYLAASAYDCIVIGGGVRLASTGLAVFETVLNTARKIAPATSIAFNTRPEDTADAAARSIARD